MSERAGVDPPPRLTAERLRHRRLLMFWISLPVVLLVFVTSVMLLSRAPTAQRAIDAYDQGRYVSSERISESLLAPNLVEPYLPYFNRGDAFAADQYYGPATDDFERALELAPQDRQCDVRLNLALTWERFGDIYLANGFPQGAILLYRASEAVLDAAGPECDPPEKRFKLEESQDRVEEKTAEAERQRDASTATRPPGAPDDQEQRLRELGEQQGKADQEKADDQSEERGDPGGGYSVDRPW